MTDRHDFTVFSPSEASSSGADARRFVRHARSAALATLDAARKTPFASLVAIATDAQGDPILLLSQLARHTKNLRQDAAASLLISNPASGTDPLTTTRVTLQGRIVQQQAADVGDRFLMWQPEAADYAGFSDFGFYRMAVESVHVVAGFGRIQSSMREAYLVKPGDALTMSPSELSDINGQCEEAIAKQWCALTGQDGAPLNRTPRIVLADGDGCLLSDGEAVARLTLVTPIRSASDLKCALEKSAVA
jgi:heme oxygenase (biliverdin-IX-beta and delta-forming)